MRQWLLAIAVAFSCGILARPARADVPPLLPGGKNAEDKAADEAAGDAGSPRAAMASFLSLARSGELEQAAKYLQLPKGDEGRATALAERLRFVLERHDAADPDELSNKPEGKENDGLADDVDRVAVIHSPSGKSDDVLLKRVTTPDGKRWLFARDTVARVDGWYDALESRWQLQHLPEPLRRGGPLGLLWWQWGAFLVLAAAAWLVAIILGKLTARA
ncbi:MAG: mechanosensitive ion channel family protein, partial [Polyangiaceae bacterium]|nr:mechanosensitive ion channel family protein [Polyangiaceae bacterium]